MAQAVQPRRVEVGHLVVVSSLVSLPPSFLQPFLALTLSIFLCSIGMASTAVEASSQRRILDFWKLQRKDKERLREDVETLYGAVSEGMEAFPTPSDADYTVLYKVCLLPPFLSLFALLDSFSYTMAQLWF